MGCRETERKTKTRWEDDENLREAIDDLVKKRGQTALFVLDEHTPIYDFSREIDWLGLAILIGEGVVSGVAGEVTIEAIKRAFGLNINYCQRFDNAVREVAAQVREAIDDAFVQEYVSDCNSCGSRLMTYADTKNKQILYDEESHMSRIVARLDAFGFRRVGAYVLAADMHLMVLRALAHVEAGYKATLTRLCYDYADKGSSKATEFYEDIITWSVSQCNCPRGPERPHEPVDPIPQYYTCSFTYDYGVGHRDFTEPEQEVALNKCNRARQKYWQDRETAARAIRNPLIDTCNAWRRVKV